MAGGSKIFLLKTHMRQVSERTDQQKSILLSVYQTVAEQDIVVKPSAVARH